MKKYTNKILAVTIAAFLVIATVLFFVRASEVKQEIEQYKTTKKEGGLS